MAEITSLGISVPNSDIRRIVTGNHNKIMGLFLIYLRSPADSRAALAKEILHQLAGHLAIVEERLFPQNPERWEPRARRSSGTPSGNMKN